MGGGEYNEGLADDQEEKEMSFPEQIKVFNDVYRVVFSDSIPGENCLACIDPDKLTIWIHTSTHKSLLAETLWHEVKHAINAFFDIDDSSTEEEFVSLSAKGDIAVLRDNPLLLELIKADRQNSLDS